MATTATLESATLDPRERATLETFAREVTETYGDRLHGLWLYGSRARGEPARPGSDVDLMLILDRAEGTQAEHMVAYNLLYDAAEAEGAEIAYFSLHLQDEQWLRGRREIESFFIQEVDRDKVVLAGSP